MILPLTYLASAEAAPSGDLFAALGIDWTALVINIVAFLILMWFLGKFVYPPLSRSLEKRQDDIEAAAQAATETRERADKVEADVQKLLTRARKDAAEIMATAKSEATELLAKSEQRSREQAKNLVDAAHDDIAKEVENARKTLYNDAVDLVVQATARVTQQTVDAAHDKKLVAKSLEEAR